ncbi:MAG: hypothetical protein ACE5OW_06990 [Candidatus Bathyarchaeia archaeon]
MSEKKELHEKAREEMTLSERILAELPGFKGYKEKEMRRETDKLIRNHLYRKLSEARNDLKEVFQQLSERRLHEVLTEMDRLIMRFDRVAEKINHASYGYAGFFNILKIREGKLNKMIAFDRGLIDHVKEILDETTVFKGEVVKNELERVREHIQKLRSSLESLEEKFDKRGETILDVK